MSDYRRFKDDHPKWTSKMDTQKILNEIYKGLRKRLQQELLIVMTPGKEFS